MPDDFRIIKVSAPSELQTVAARHALCGQIVNGFCVESVGFCEPVHVEGDVWVSRCYVEGRRVDAERAPMLYLPVT